MKKILLMVFTSLCFLTGCEYDDSALNDRIDGIEDRLAKLEELCSRLNSDIDALQSVVTALQENDYVTSIDPIVENGRTVGYTISFSKSGTIAIYHGKDGESGQDGAAGKDGHHPEIGIGSDSDGSYYWTLDGEWLLDEGGNRIKVDTQDGADGEDGANGKDGVTPQLKIEEGYWWISYDNGRIWKRLQKAVGENGTDGADGEDAVSFFKDVDASNPDYVVFHLKDGSEIRIPTWEAFEDLQRSCNEMNTNISALQTIVDALGKKDYVESVTPVYENGKNVGYDIVFSQSGTVRIYHGKDGEQGTPGQDATAPVIGVKSDSEGVYYWTLDGEWLLDSEGNRIRVQGSDGSDGEQGPQGPDGEVPELKIENGYWYVLYDEEEGWIQLGRATGEDGQPGVGIDGDPMFRKVYSDERNLYLVLSDGTELTLPMASSLKQDKINSLTYIPEYSDGKADVVIPEGAAFGTMEFTFRLDPVGALDNLQSNWKSNISMQAFYLSDGDSAHSTNGVDLPVESFVMDFDKELFTITVSGEHLDAGFYEGRIQAVATLTIRDGESEIASDFIPIVTLNHFLYGYDVILYTASNKKPVNPISMPHCISNEYDAERNLGIMKFKGLRTVPVEAFYYCYTLTSIILPEGITFIDNSAFEECINLKSIELPNSLKTIGVETFAGCVSLKSIDLPDKLESINESAFSGCISLQSVRIPDSVTFLDDGVFSYCISLESIVLPKNLEVISSGLVSECESLKTIFIPESVTDICSYAFFGCISLESIILPENIKVLQGNSFSNCISLKSVVLPENLEEFEDFVFESCHSLTSIVIPSTVEYIGYCSFADCRVLKSVRMLSPQPCVLDYEVFEWTSPDMKIYVPEESVDDYRNAENWSDYRECITAYTGGAQTSEREL